MKKFLSFLTAILFAGSMMAADYVKVTEAPTDWSGDYLFVYEAENVAFNGGLATLDAAANTIAVEITDEKIAATDATNAAKFTLAAVEGGYSVQSASGKFIGVSSYGNGLKQADAVGSYVHNSLTIDESGNAIIGIYNASWNTTGGTMILNFNANKSDKRFRYYKDGSQKKIQLYKYVAEAAQGGETTSTTKTIYCSPFSEWHNDGARFAVYALGDGENTAWYDLVAVEGAENVYSAEIAEAFPTVIFCRMNGETTENNWDNKWNQTADLALPTDGKNLYTITGWNENDGEWSVYTAQGGDDPVEPTPAEKDSIYFVNVAGWAAPRVHLWGGTAAGTEWPGVEMTKLADKINNYDVYKYVADKGAYANCLFSDNGAEDKKTADLDWTSGKYFYNDTWYALNEIPVPLPDAVPLEGNIWKVTAETPLVAGSHYINEALLTMDGVYATTLKTNTRTIAGEEFTHAIQVRTDGYPTAENKAGKEKSGSTSLIITAKEDADVTFYYNRQVLGEGGTDNDNKDLIVFDQADITTKIAGVFTIDQILEGNNYMNVTKKVALKKDHTYTVTASGTTLQLHGIKLEAHFPVMQIAGAWNVQDEAWLLNDMSLAEDKLTATYEVELAKGDYEFKMIKDGAWLTKANSGQAYGLHREWPGVAGVIDDATENLKVTADVAGNYTFTWTFANDSIGIAFPDTPVEPTAKFYVTGDSALIADAAPAGTAVWASNAIKSEKDTLVLNLKAGVDYQLSLTIDGTWNTKKTYTDLTMEDKSGLYDVDGDNHNIGFKLNEAGVVKVIYIAGESPIFKLEGKFFVKEEPETVTVHFVNTPKWDGVNVHLWNSLSSDPIVGTQWPGEAMEKEETQVHGYDVYSYTFVNENNYDMCIFNNNANQTKDLTLQNGKYFCDSLWYESLEDIPAIVEKEPIYTVAGNLVSVFGAEWAPENEANDMVKQEDGTYKWEKAELTLAKGTEILFKVVKDHSWNVAYPADNYVLNIEADGVYTITITFNPESNVVNAVVTKDADAEIEPAEINYYLVGSMTDWVVNEEYKFAANEENEGEFLFTTTLAATDLFKVVKVQGEQKTWYPDGMDNNYVVDVAHAGEKTIYFRPDGQGGEGWHYGYIYVPANEVVIVPAKFYVSGDSALIADAAPAGTAVWASNAIKSEKDTLVLNLKAGVDYQLSLTIDGTWNTKKTYTDLTMEDKSGLYDVAGDNHNIGFKLNEAGVVKVIYIAGESPIFKLEGNFYVEPVEEGCDWENIEFLGGPAENANQFKVCKPENVSVVNIQNPNWSEKTQMGIYMTFPSAAFGEISLDEALYEKQGAGILFFLSAFTAQETEVSVVCEGNTYVFTVYNAKASEPVVEHTYTVAGSSEIAFGTTWDPENAANDMVKQEDGTYKWEKNDLILAAGTVLFKVCEDHAWDVAYPAENYQLPIAEAGIYTITITFNPETKAVDAVATKTGDAEVEHTYTVAGSSEIAFGTAWDPENAANDMVKQEDGTYKWEKNDLVLAAGTVLFKVCEDHAWDVAYPASDYQLAIAEAGEYTITITFNPETKAVDAVATKTGDAEVTVNYYLVGSVKGWEAKAENIFTLNTEAGEGIEEYVIETTLEVGEGLKVVSSTGTWYPEGTGNEYVVDQNHAGMTTIYFRPAGNAEWEAFGGFMYVVPTVPTGIDPVEVDPNAPALKVLRNGHIFIIKGEKTYNVMGALVR